MSTLKQRRVARKSYQTAKKTPVGSGKRFKVVEKIAKLGGAKNPAAVAGKIFWEKYGKIKGSKIISKAKKNK